MEGLQKITRWPPYTTPRPSPSRSHTTLVDATLGDARRVANHHRRTRAFPPNIVSIISLHAKGLDHGGDRRAPGRDLYGTKVSQELISKVTQVSVISVPARSATPERMLNKADEVSSRGQVASEASNRQCELFGVDIDT
ncbi:hypothetical protein GCM10023175_43330 [Pseudonocardia xishanensis]|uniref:Uncharacterized protein n=1 Tax=Pseudonocardia xishanensis TaxID=630995 RepID=A0ABP8RXF6_9PSEU